MNNMKVSAKLAVSFILIIVMAIAVGMVGILGMRSLQNSAVDLYNNNLIAVSCISELRELLNKERTDMHGILTTKDDQATLDSLLNKFTIYDKTAADIFAQYEATISDEALQAPYYSAKASYLGEYAEVKKKIFALVKAGSFEEAHNVFTDTASSVAEPINEGFAESSQHNNEWALSKNDFNGRLYKTLTIALISTLLAATGIASFLILYLSGLISRPISAMTKYLKRVSETGDLALSNEDMALIGKYSENKDEIGVCVNSTAKFVTRVLDISHALELVSRGDLSVKLVLLTEKDDMGISLQQMVANLNQMFSGINSSAIQVSNGARQISDGSQSLAEGTAEQAASIEELLNSISGVASQTKLNAEMAGEAAGLAGHIREKAQKGSEQMDMMTQAVEEINGASQAISKVIKVIDDIAFQTNILALNAAVEAARAGQHGKGFAVVAEEVRNLAAKSAEAARNTAELIENSIEKAGLGVRISNETAMSLGEIVSGINESAKLVNKIAGSSETQSTTIDQINKGIEQLTQVVQQNSATAQESAAASEELNGQSTMLENLVSKFKLDD